MKVVTFLLIFISSFTLAAGNDTFIGRATGVLTIRLDDTGNAGNFSVSITCM